MARGLIGAIEQSEFNLRRALARTKDENFKKVLEEKLSHSMYKLNRTT